MRSAWSRMDSCQTAPSPALASPLMPPDARPEGAVRRKGSSLDASNALKATALHCQPCLLISRVVATPPRTGTDSGKSHSGAQGQRRRPRPIRRRFLCGLRTAWSDWRRRSRPKMTCSEPRPALSFWPETEVGALWRGRRSAMRQTIWLSFTRRGRSVWSEMTCSGGRE